MGRLSSQDQPFNLIDERDLFIWSIPHDGKLTIYYIYLHRINQNTFLLESDLEVKKSSKKSRFFFISPLGIILREDNLIKRN